VKDKAQLSSAKLLLEAYEHERVTRVQAEYEQLARSGQAQTLMDVIKSNPVRFIAYVAIIALILTISLQKLHFTSVVKLKLDLSRIAVVGRCMLLDNCSCVVLLTGILP